MSHRTTTVTDLDVFDAFVRSLLTSAATIDYLSVTIDAKSLQELYAETHQPEDDTRLGSASTKRLWRLLDNLRQTLPRMKGLNSFRLKVSTGCNGFWIARPMISNLLQSLPKSCTAIDLNTRGYDYAQPGSVHLDDTIGQTLVRLEHLSLHLSNICPAAFVVTTDYPLLKTLTVSCFARGFHTARLCGTYTEDPLQCALGQGQEAMPHLVRQVRSLSQRCPRISSVLLCDKSWINSEDPASHQSFNQRDILNDTVTAMPLTRIDLLVQDGNMLRSPAADIFGTVRDFEWLLEAGQEQEYQTASEVEVPPSFLDLEAWKVKYPKRSCVLWLNEKNTGQRLLEVLLVAGAEKEVSQCEKTPYGWKRMQDGQLYPNETN